MGNERSIKERKRNMTNILIADDEKDIIKLLRIYLEKEGFHIYEAYDGVMAYMILKNYDIDIALIDIMMPQMNGFDLIKKVRCTMDIPILVISAKVDLSDRILGLDLGADDYILKPFEPLEVIAKVRARMRWLKSGSIEEKERMIYLEDLALDTHECCLIKNNEIIELSKTEYLVLKLFMENSGRVFTKEQIYSAGWNDDYAVDDNTIRVMISKLRDKIGSDKIKTIRGLGYRMVKYEKTEK